MQHAVTLDGGIDRFRRETGEELSRFFQLWKRVDRPLAMFSQGIDRAWHELMEQSKAYHEFCISSVGARVTHVPGGGMFYHGIDAPEEGPAAAYDWVPDYELTWGKLSASWFADENGVIDQARYELYLRDGVIVAAWDCGPQQ